MYFPSETFVVISSTALIVYVSYTFRWKETRLGEIENIEDNKDRQQLKIEVMKTVLQATALVGIAFAALFSWHNFTQTDSKHFFDSAIKNLPAALAQLKSNKSEERIAGILAVENLASRSPETYGLLLDNSLKALGVTCASFQKNADSAVPLALDVEMAIEIAKRTDFSAKCLASDGSRNPAAKLSSTP